MLEGLGQVTRKLFLRSFLGKNIFVSRPKPPEPWPNVLWRLGVLYPDENTDHVRILHHGESFAFDPGILAQFPAPETHDSEKMGLAKSGKSESDRRLHKLFASLAIRHQFWREYRPFELPWVDNPIEINRYRALRNAAAIAITATEQKDGTYLQRAHNFISYEAAIIHSLLFASLLEETTGHHAHQPFIASLVREHLPYYDAVLTFDITPQESKRRGSRMDIRKLEAWHNLLEQAPKRVARLHRNCPRPLLWVTINTEKLSPEAMPGFLQRTFGTILGSYDHTQPAVSKMEVIQQLQG